MKTLEISALVLALAVSISAQNGPRSDTAASLVNNGTPMTIPFHCTDDDIEWAGMSCSDQDPCPVYLEVTGTESFGNKILAAGNLHSETVTLYSVLLGSDDAGKTWREAYERIRGAGFDRIQFLDLANGWISGGSLYPLPQDPFLLTTTDGGNSWRRQPIFSEPRIGSVQQFLFTNKDAGALVIDRGEGSEEERYALYESPDGGRSWNVKELNKKPIRLSRAPETERDWRVRANRATQSFRLEHRQGERWVQAASFAVSAGFCKPAVQETPPPEEEQPDKADPPPASSKQHH